MRISAALTIASCLFFSALAVAGGHGGGHSGQHNPGSHNSATKTGGSHTGASKVDHAKQSAAHSGKPPSGQHTSKYAQGVQRDSSGKIARIPKAKSDFQKQNPCPSTGKSSGSCPGYVTDHVTPLKRGGADAPNNMQWQTTAAAKQKDKSE